MPSGAALTGCNLAGRGIASAEAERGIAAHPVLVQPVRLHSRGQEFVSNNQQRGCGNVLKGLGEKARGDGRSEPAGRGSASRIKETRANLAVGALSGIDVNRRSSELAARS